MAARTIIPLLTGGAIVTAALAFAYVRRPSRAPVLMQGEVAHLEPESVGPDDGMLEVLDLARGPHPKARNEAEAIEDASAAWPTLELAPPSTDGMRPSLADTYMADPEGNLVRHGSPDLLNADTLELEDDPDFDEQTGNATLASGIHSGFAEVKPDEVFLDLEIEFEELETPTHRSAEVDLARRSRQEGESLAPEDLGAEWLARATEAPALVASDVYEVEGLQVTTLEQLEQMDTLEDFSEAPTDPMAAVSYTREPERAAAKPAGKHGKRAGSRRS